MTRKKFTNTRTGGEVTSQPSLPVDDIFEPSPHVKLALTVPCPECSAKTGEQCAYIIDARVTRDVPHAGRIEAGRKAAAEIRDLTVSQAVDRDVGHVVDGATDDVAPPRRRKP